MRRGRKIYKKVFYLCFSSGRRLRGKAFYNVNGKVYCEEDFLVSYYYYCCYDRHLSCESYVCSSAVSWWWWATVAGLYSESEGLRSQATFCNPPEETHSTATIRSLAPPLQFTLIPPLPTLHPPPKFPRGPQLPHELLGSTYN